jgi:hypothetical protein
VTLEQPDLPVPRGAVLMPTTPETGAMASCRSQVGSEASGGASVHGALIAWMWKQ